MLRPAFVVEELVKGNLVLNKAFPLVQPFVRDQVPNFLWSRAFLVREDHQLAFYLTPLSQVVKFCYCCEIRVVDQMLEEL